MGCRDGRTRRQKVNERKWPKSTREDEKKVARPEEWQKAPCRSRLCRRIPHCSAPCFPLSAHFFPLFLFPHFPHFFNASASPCAHSWRSERCKSGKKKSPLTVKKARKTTSNESKTQSNLVILFYFFCCWWFLPSVQWFWKGRNVQKKNKYENRNWTHLYYTPSYLSVRNLRPSFSDDSILFETGQCFILFLLTVSWQLMDEKDRNIVTLPSMWITTELVLLAVKSKMIFFLIFFLLIQ